MLGNNIVMSQHWSETYSQAFVKLLNSQILIQAAESSVGTASCSGCNNWTKQQAHLSSRLQQIATLANLW